MRDCVLKLYNLWSDFYFLSLSLADFKHLELVSWSVAEVRQRFQYQFHNFSWTTYLFFLGSNFCTSKEEFILIIASYVWRINRLKAWVLESGCLVRTPILEDSAVILNTFGNVPLLHFLHLENWDVYNEYFIRWSRKLNNLMCINLSTEANKQK